MATYPVSTPVVLSDNQPVGPTILPPSAQSISSALPPVPGYLVGQIIKGEYVDFMMLCVSDLLAYFLLLAVADREIPGLGWLDYDVAFRQQAAGKPSLV